MQPFPLLKLPYLPVEECLRSLDPVDLFNLSQSSNKLRSVVRCLNRQIGAQYILNIHLDTTCRLGFRHKTVPGVQEDYHMKYPIECSGIETTQNLALSVLSVFDSLKLVVHLYLDDVDDTSRESMFDWAQNNEQSIDEIYYEGHASDYEIVVKYLTTFKKCRIVNLRTRARETFRLNQPLEMNGLRLIYGAWVTIDNIWDFNVRLLLIQHCSLNSKDINQYLKDWRTGAKTNQSLVRLHLSPIQFRVEEVFETIEYTKTTFEELQRTLLGLVSEAYFVFNEKNTRKMAVFESRDESTVFLNINSLTV